MTTNNKLARYKQQRMRSLVGKSDSYSFFNLLTGPEMFTKVEELLPELYRERQFPPTETLSMFLAQAMNEDSSCQKIINEVAVKQAVGGLTPCSTHTGGYCQARQRLPLDMVSTLTRYLLAYNLIRLLMAQSALLADVLPRELSFKHTVQLWLAWNQQTQAIEVYADVGILFALIAQNIVGNRPGRIEPRAVKRRPKPFSLLMVSRALARDRVRKHGHLKKIKA